MCKNGAEVRTLSSHQRGQDPDRGNDAIIMWVEFVVGSLFCSERFFSGYYGFPLSSKTTFPNSNSTTNQVEKRRPDTSAVRRLVDEEPLCGFATSKSLFVYLFIIYLFITTRYDNCWQKHFNCISLYYFVDYVHNVSKIQSNPRGSERVSTKPVTFRTKKVLTASNILVINCYISGYCYILRQKLLHNLLATWGQPWECSVYYRIARRCFTDEMVWSSPGV